MASKSSLSSSSVAKSRIVSKSLRSWIALDSGEVFVIAIWRTTGDSSLLDSACSMMSLRVVGGTSVLSVCDGDEDFMVVVDKALAFLEWSLRIMVKRKWDIK
jgi:hypothetical protein